MTSKKLLRENRITPFECSANKVYEQIELAERDLKAAKRMSGSSYDWTYNIAYNAVLQAAQALMFTQGYRAIGKERHKTILEFVTEVLKTKTEMKLNFFDKMRKKRHQAVYDKAGTISKKEAEHALQAAERFVDLIRNHLS